jgi:hypothetical protein
LTEHPEAIREKLARLSASLWACDAGLAEQSLLVDQATKMDVRLVEAKRRLNVLANKAKMEASDVRYLRFPGPTTIALLLIGRLAQQKAKEERESMLADAAVQLAHEEVESLQDSVKTLRERITRLEALRVRRQELLQEKEGFLRSRGIPFMPALDDFDAKLARLKAHETLVHEAMAISQEARAKIAQIRSVDRDDPYPPAIDVMLFGVFTAAQSKMRGNTTLPVLVWELRDILRRLTASPIVEAPELIEIIPLPTEGSYLAETDSSGIAWPTPLGTLMNVGALQQTKSTWQDSLWFVTGKLHLLEERLAVRLTNLAGEREALEHDRDSALRRM